jgi:hypothetical protein
MGNVVEPACRTQAGPPIEGGHQRLGQGCRSIPSGLPTRHEGIVSKRLTARTSPARVSRGSRSAIRSHRHTCGSSMGRSNRSTRRRPVLTILALLSGGDHALAGQQPFIGRSGIQKVPEIDGDTNTRSGFGCRGGQPHTMIVFVGEDCDKWRGSGLPVSHSPSTACAPSTQFAECFRKGSDRIAE